MVPFRDVIRISQTTGIFKAAGHLVHLNYSHKTARITMLASHESPALLFRIHPASDSAATQRKSGLQGAFQQVRYIIPTQFFLECGDRRIFTDKEEFDTSHLGEIFQVFCGQR
jgi:hypothetical protein